LPDEIPVPVLSSLEEPELLLDEPEPDEPELESSELPVDVEFVCVAAAE
jgi:hypothetical protein